MYPIYGCGVSVLMPMRPHSLGQQFHRKAVLGMLVGYEGGSKAYKFMVAEKKVRVSRDVVFFASHFGDVTVGLVMREKLSGKF